MGISYENKRVRIPEVGFRTFKIPYSDAADIAAAKPEEIWTTGMGHEILVRHMETSHIVSAMAIIYKRQYDALRNSGMPGFKIEDPDKNQNTHTRNMVRKLCIERRPVYKTMMEELEIRGGKKKRKPEPEQKPLLRKFDF